MRTAEREFFVHKSTFSSAEAGITGPEEQPAVGQGRERAAGLQDLFGGALLRSPVHGDLLISSCTKYRGRYEAVASIYWIYWLRTEQAGEGLP
jgi:hypothetical protein